MILPNPLMPAAASVLIGPAEMPEDRRKAVTDSLRQMIGQEEQTAYIASLKQQSRIRISKEMLEKKDR